MARDLMLNAEEYSALLRLIKSERESEGATKSEDSNPAPQKKRRVSVYQKEFGRQYKRLKGQHTLNNGSMRKGWTPRRLMSAAHTAAKRARK